MWRRFWTIFLLLWLCLPTADPAFAQGETRLAAVRPPDQPVTVNPPTNVSDLLTTGSEPAARTPAPLPATPPPISYLPPISLRETLRLMDRVSSTLSRQAPAVAVVTTPGAAVPAPPAPEVPVESLQRMIRSCINYLRYRDDIHTSLSDYEWVELDDERVENSPDAPDQDAILFEPPVERISAISLQATGGDVRVHRIRVIDEKNSTRQLFDYDSKPLLVRHLLPRREVFHLWRRTTISRIELEYARVDSTGGVRPRIIIFGGTTSRREYIKTALFQLELASDRLNRKDWARALDAVAEAKEGLGDYMRKNDLE